MGVAWRAALLVGLTATGAGAEGLAPAAAPLLVVRKTVVDENRGAVLPGDTLGYSVTVTNAGTLAARGTTLRDAVPAATQLVAGSLTVNGAAAPDPSGLVVASLGDLAPGATATVRFRVRVGAQALVGTQIANQAFVEHDGGQIVASDDPATVAADDATTVAVGGGALLTSAVLGYDPTPVGDNGNGRFDVGERIQYRLTVQNTGDAPAHGVTFTDPVPPFTAIDPGQVTVDGRAVAATLTASGNLVVPVGTLFPGATARVAFRAAILAGVGAQVSNQGTVTSDDTRPELTDADGNDGNGDQPTTTPVGRAAPLAVTVAIADVNGGTVAPGDRLQVTLTARNQGATALDDVRLTDRLPAGLTLVDGSTTWPAQVDVQGGVLSLRGARLAAGASVVASFAATVAADARDGASLCDAADASVGATGDAVTSTPACVVVGNVQGMGRLVGRTLLRGKVPAEDTALANLTVQVFRDGDARRAPVAGLLSDAQGQYRLPAVPPGSYRIRVLTSRGAQLAEEGGVTISAAAPTVRDVRVDPSGRVYDATTGTFVQDVRVFLYYDETDPVEPGQLVPADRLGAGQQGQVTPAEGFYRFDVLAGRRYRLRVETGLAYAFPSMLVPPTPGFAPPGPVVPDPAPSLDPNRVRTYYLRFNVAAPGQDVTNNHVPLDPSGAQIRLTKRADRPQATVGDIVTYTVTVQNRSARDLTAAAGELVFVRDTPARGLTYLRGRAAAQVQKGTQVTRLGAGAGFGETILSPTSAAQLQWGPFDLAAGATLTLTYHMVVGLDTRRGEYANTAVLVSGGGTRLSNPDTVRLQVASDPIFDQSLVIGKLFCDRNGDGRQGPGEPGIMGARVYVDTGSYARTDEAGKYHLSQLEPGVHLVKVDEHTLPPGVRLPDPSRVVTLTRGLVARASFAATCPADLGVRVTPADPGGTLVLASRAPPGPREGPKTSTTISGDLRTLAVAVDGKPVPLPQLDLELAADPSLVLPPAAGSAGPNLVAPGDGGWVPTRPVFRARWTGESPASWTLVIARGGARGEVARTIGGAGTPDAIVWDGLGDDGKPVARDAVYQAQLRVDGAGAAETAAASARKPFGVAYGLPAAAVKERTLRGDFFAGSARRPTLTAALAKSLRELVPGVGAEDTVLVEVHDDGTGDKLESLARTQRQADAARDALVAAGVPAARIKAKGRGSLAPVAGVKTRDGRALNRRVVITITPPAPAGATGAAVPSPPLGTADALIAGEPATLAADGRFVKNLPTPADGKILIDLVAADGRRVSTTLLVAPGAPAAAPPPPAAPPSPGGERGPHATLVGDFVAGTLTYDGEPVDTSLLRIDARIAGAAPEPSFDLGAGPATLARAISFQLAVPPQVDVARWILVVTKAAAAAPPVRRIAGSGAPPPSFEWDGRDEAGVLILAPGNRYRYRLVVDDERGGRGESAERFFLVGTGGKGKPFPPTYVKRTLFTPRGDVNATLKNELSSLAAAVKRRPASERYRVEIGIGTRTPADNTTDARMAVAVRAGKVRTYATRLGLPLERVDLVVGPAASGKERRDSLAITAVSRDPAPAPAPRPPRIVIDGQNPGSQGSGFAADVPVTPGQPVLVDMGTAGGQHAVWLVAPPAPAPASAPAAPSSSGTTPPAPPAPAATTTTTTATATTTKLPRFAQLDRAPALTLSLAGDRAAPEGGALGSAAVPAANLVVNLPPRGIELRSPELWVSGKTDPTNQVKVNGTPATVRRDGRFDTVVALPPGDSILVVEAVDAARDVATISWPVRVSETEHFLLVLAEGTAATGYDTQLGGWSADAALIDGNGSDDTTSVGHVLLHGRLALYYKGRIKGGALFRHYDITAHLDTAKQAAFQEFFQETIDPNRDYAVYGDSAQEVRDAKARGKLYVLVEADDSRALVGNFKTDLGPAASAGPLFRYDRTVYGAEVDFKKTFGPVKQEVKAFGTTGDGSLARDVNLFRATGGSLYYLRHGRLVEGGERIRVVVRDRDNGLVLDERQPLRDADYTIDYPGGRVMFKSPIASVADAAHALGNLDAHTAPLGGNPVYIEVSYEYRADSQAAAGAGGVYVRDTLFGALALGAGVVGEQRGDGGGLGDYSLAGADATFTHKRTTVHVEIARSNATDAGNYLSEDGGLTFQGLDAIAATTPGAERGGHVAWRVDLDTTLGDFVRSAPLERTRVHLYAEDVDRGFSSGGTMLEQGRTKVGGTVAFVLDEHDRFRLRHDAELAYLPRVGPDVASVLANPDPLQLDQRASYITSLQWAHSVGRWDLTVEGQHQRLSTTAALADLMTPQIDSDRWGLGALLSWKQSRKLTLRVGQEAQFASGMDPVLAPGGTTDALYGVATTAGADWKLAPDVVVSGTGVLRWNGDTGLIAGLKTPVGDDASLYLNQRLDDARGRLTSTSLVGAEQRFGAAAGGKAYGEYQLESGVAGDRNRAVLGVGHRWALARGWNLAGGYEHQQVFNAHLPDGTAIGDGRRDVLHLGTEYLRLDLIKASASVEVRFDDGIGGGAAGVSDGLVAQDPRPVAPPGTFPDHGGPAPGAPLILPPGKRTQIVAAAGADWKWTGDQTFLVRFRLADTRGSNSNDPAGDSQEFTMARFVEATAGWAYRPLQLDWLDILVKYSFLYDLRPVDVAGLSSIDLSHVVSLAPVVDLPRGLRLSGKLAWKRTTSQSELVLGQGLDSTVDTLLGLVRLGYLLGGRWELAGEYRVLRMILPAGGETRHGLLVEADYAVDRRVRLGVGYNFSHFSDDELGDLARDTHGFFFRVVGRY
jgi:uncharacterized repeat protein (TIGR01451 family)